MRMSIVRTMGKKIRLWRKTRLGKETLLKKKFCIWRIWKKAWLRN